MILHLSYRHIFLAHGNLTTATIINPPGQSLQCEGFGDITKFLVRFLDRDNTPVGIGIFLRIQWENRIFAHEDNLPNTPDIRFKAIVTNREVFGTAMRGFLYRNRYRLLVVSIV